ncbi:MAG: hypothetical protein RIQ99_1875, partial [Pseudomonadota bacterium]
MNPSMASAVAHIPFEAAFAASLALGLL